MSRPTSFNGSTIAAVDARHSRNRATFGRRFLVAATVREDGS
jgi:hypothetical protein